MENWSFQEVALDLAVDVGSAADFAGATSAAAVKKCFDVVVADLDAASTDLDGLGSLVGIERSYTCFVASAAAAVHTCFEHVGHGFEEMQLMLASSIEEYGIWEDMDVAYVQLPLIPGFLFQQVSPQVQLINSAGLDGPWCSEWSPPDEEYCPVVGVV